MSSSLALVSFDCATGRKIISPVYAKAIAVLASPLFLTLVTSLFLWVKARRSEQPFTRSKVWGAALVCCFLT